MTVSVDDMLAVEDVVCEDEVVELVVVSGWTLLLDG